MSVLSLNKISYSYKNGKNILDDISIEFEKGKFYTILGVSGSGKTTLLSLLAGLDEPRKGEVLYNNEDIKIKGYENHRKNNISLIFQNYNLIDYMTPLENLRIINQKADKSILNNLGLGDEEINRNVLQLSGGQQQRVAIARALINEPKILLADEPTSALDVTTQAQIVRQMMELRDDYGTGIIIVTHNIGVAAYMADQLIVMHHGKVVDHGTREEVLNNPTSDYTRKLLEAVPEMEGKRYV